MSDFIDDLLDDAPSGPIPTPINRNHGPAHGHMVPNPGIHVANKPAVGHPPSGGPIRLPSQMPSANPRAPANYATHPPGVNQGYADPRMVAPAATSMHMPSGISAPGIPSSVPKAGIVLKGAPTSAVPVNPSSVRMMTGVQPGIPSSGLSSMAVPSGGGGLQSMAVPGNHAPAQRLAPQHAPQPQVHHAPAAQAKPQPVSKAASSAAAANPVPISAPPVKKQMVNENGASRARNADGTAASSRDGEGDDDEEDLIPKDERTRDPIIYGKAMSDDLLRAERAKDEQRRLVNPQVVRIRVDAVCKEMGMSYDPRIAETISLALQQRIDDALRTFVANSKRRMDVEGESCISGDSVLATAADGSASRVVRSSNARLYFTEQEKKKQEARDARVAAKLAAESGTALMDASAKRRETEEMEETVLGFGGPRRRNANIDSLMSGVESSGGGLLAAGPLGGATMGATAHSASASSAISIKDRKRRVTLGDALTFLRSDEHMKHTQLTLNTLAGIKVPESAVYTASQLAAPSSSSRPSMGVTTRSSAVTQPPSAAPSAATSTIPKYTVNPVPVVVKTNPAVGVSAGIPQGGARPPTANAGLASFSNQTHTRPVPGNQPPPGMMSKGPSMAPSMPPTRK